MSRKNLYAFTLLKCEIKEVDSLRKNKNYEQFFDEFIFDKADQTKYSVSPIDNLYPIIKILERQFQLETFDFNVLYFTETCYIDGNLAFSKSLNHKITTFQKCKDWIDANFEPTK